MPKRGMTCKSSPVHIWIQAFVILYGYLESLGSIPDKYSEPQFRRFLILGLQRRDDTLHLVIRDDGENRIIQCRPCVIAIVRLTVHRTTALDIVPKSETSLSIGVEDFENFLAERLIV